MKLNKAEKFIKRQFEKGMTRNMVREAIFKKLGTWNFPPEYENALATQDPNFDKDNEPLLGVDYLDDYICDVCGNCHELCFCGEDADEPWKSLGHSAEAEEAVFGHQATNHNIKCPGKKTDICTECPQKTFCTIITGDSNCLFCHGNPCVCDDIKLPKLPEPGTQDWERMVDNMRQQLEYMPIIKAAKESIEARGLDFDEEFEKFKANKK
jgi:hypothetical protein